MKHVLLNAIALFLLVIVFMACKKDNDSSGSGEKSCRPRSLR
ncbi:MAG: hypothetical protein QM687_11700 [Ferruginibacter sp.]